MDSNMTVYQFSLMEIYAIYCLDTVFINVNVDWFFREKEY